MKDRTTVTGPLPLHFPRVRGVESCTYSAYTAKGVVFLAYEGVKVN